MAKFFRLTLLACDPLRISSIHSRKIKTKHARPAATAADPTHVGHPHVFIQARDFLSTTNSIPLSLLHAQDTSGVQSNPKSRVSNRTALPHEFFSHPKFKPKQGGQQLRVRKVHSTSLTAAPFDRLLSTPPAFGSYLDPPSFCRLWICLQPPLASIAYCRPPPLQSPTVDLRRFNRLLSTSTGRSYTLFSCSRRSLRLPFRRALPRTLPLPTAAAGSPRRTPAETRPPAVGKPLSAGGIPENIPPENPKSPRASSGGGVIQKLKRILT